MSPFPYKRHNSKVKKIYCLFGALLNILAKTTSKDLNGCINRMSIKNVLTSKGSFLGPGLYYLCRPQTAAPNSCATFPFIHQHTCIFTGECYCGVWHPLCRRRVSDHQLHCVLRWLRGGRAHRGGRAELP